MTRSHGGAATHPAWIEVDHGALVHNARALRAALDPGTRLGLLVKANGYGHGLEIAAAAAIEGGADQLIVATLDEALALRAAGIDGALLVVYPITPDGVGPAVEAGIELSAGSLEGLHRTLAGAGGIGSLRLHVEVDTGMGRGGIAAGDLVEAARRVDATAGATLAGVWSHLADGRDATRSGEQSARFDAALDALAASGRVLPPRHLLATEGLLADTAPAYEMVRIGLGYYGELGLDLEPAVARAGLAAALRPAMTVKARAIRIEELPTGATVGYGGEWRAERASRIATLPIGYADGWARSSWPGAEALVRGRRVPLVGRVSMDSVCADVTDLDRIDHDDEFVLLGGQGDDRIGTGDLARLRRTIPNEVLCTLGPRLPRIVVRA